MQLDQKSLISLFPKYTNLFATTAAQPNYQLEYFIKYQLPYLIKILYNMESTWTKVTHSHQLLVMKRQPYEGLLQSFVRKLAYKAERYFNGMEERAAKSISVDQYPYTEQFDWNQQRQEFRKMLYPLLPTIQKKLAPKARYMDRQKEEEVTQCLLTVIEYYQWTKQDMTAIASKFKVDASSIMKELKAGTEPRDPLELITIDATFREQIKEYLNKKFRPFLQKREFMQGKLKYFLKETYPRHTDNSTLYRQYIRSILTRYHLRCYREIVNAFQQQIKNMANPCPYLSEYLTSINQYLSQMQSEYHRIKNNNYYLDIVRGSFLQTYQMETRRIENVFAMGRLEKYLQEAYSLVRRMGYLLERMIDVRKRERADLEDMIERLMDRAIGDLELSHKNGDSIRVLMDEEVAKLISLLDYIEDGDEQYEVNAAEKYREEQRYRERQREDRLREERDRREEQERKRKEEIQLRSEKEKQERYDRKRADYYRRIRDKEYRYKLEIKRKQEDAERQQRVEQYRRERYERKRVENEQLQKKMEEDKIRRQKYADERYRKLYETRQRQLYEYKKRKQYEYYRNRRKYEERRQAEEAKKRYRYYLDEKKKKYKEEKARKDEEERQRRYQKEKEVRYRQKQLYDEKRKERELAEQKKRDEEKRVREEKERRAEQDRKEREERAAYEKKREDERKKQYQYRIKREKEEAERKEKYRQQREAEEKRLRLERYAEYKRIKQERDAYEKRQKLYKYKQEQERIKREKEEADRKYKERQEKLERYKQEKLAKEKYYKYRKEREKAEKEYKERKEREKAYKYRIYRYKTEQLKKDQYKAEKAEKQIKEKAEKYKLEKYRIEREKQEAERKKQAEAASTKASATEKKGSKKQAAIDDYSNMYEDDDMPDEDEFKVSPGAGKNSPPNTKPVVPPVPVNNKQKPSNDFYFLNDDDVDFGKDEYYGNDFEPEDDGMPSGGYQVDIATKYLINQYNIKLFNDYLKGSSYLRKNKVNLEPMNNFNQFNIIFEEFVQNREVYLFEETISKEIFDMPYEMEEMETFQQHAAEVHRAMQESYHATLQSVEFDPETKYIFPINFENPLQIKILYFCPAFNDITLFLYSSPNTSEETQEFLDRLVEIIGYLFGVQQSEEEEQGGPQLRTIILSPENKIILNTFDKFLPNLLILYNYLYEYKNGRGVYVDQYTIDRFFYCNHPLDNIYKAIYTEEDALTDHFQKIMDKYSKDKTLQTQIKEYTLADSNFQVRFINDFKKEKDNFIKSGPATELLMLVINRVDEYENPLGISAIYVEMTKASPKPILNFFLFSSDLESNEYNQKLYELLNAEDEPRFECNTYLYFTRHNGLYEYCTWTLPLWAHVITKKKMKAVEALAVINFSMLPYYLCYKGQD